MSSEIFVAWLLYIWLRKDSASWKVNMRIIYSCGSSFIWPIIRVMWLTLLWIHWKVMGYEAESTRFFDFPFRLYSWSVPGVGLHITRTLSVRTWYPLVVSRMCFEETFIAPKSWFALWWNQQSQWWTLPSPWGPFQLGGCTVYWL